MQPWVHRLGAWRGVRLGTTVGGVLLLAAAHGAWAGPPFVTDDPEPVELHHWEVYIASERLHGTFGSQGTLPHLEVNNGAAPDLQLHIILPYAYSAAPGSSTERGLGDTELGVKYRFVQETRARPMVGVFPLLEVPTGDANRGLGSGHLLTFLPVWVQKSWGPWTSYGGGGLWINPGAGNRNYGLFGWEIQKDLSHYWTLGGEILYTTPQVVGGSDQLSFNLGGQYNLDDGHHILLSAGRSIHGDTDFQSYIAFQWTFGPRGREQGSGGGDRSSPAKGSSLVMRRAGRPAPILRSLMPDLRISNRLPDDPSGARDQ